MKKFGIILLFVLSAAAFVSGQSPSPSPMPAVSPYVRPNAEKRFKRFVNDTVGPFAWVGIGAGAAFSTAVDRPKEWGRTANGFGRRFASNFGKSVITNTVKYGLDEALRLDSHYYRSKKRDVGSRIANAFISTFTARTPSGKRTIGVPRLVGTYTANIVANETWYPARYGWKDGVKSGTISLGINSFFNLVKEFIFKK